MSTPPTIAKRFKDAIPLVDVPAFVLAGRTRARYADGRYMAFAAFVSPP